MRMVWLVGVVAGLGLVIGGCGGHDGTPTGGLEDSHSTANVPASSDSVTSTIASPKIVVESTTPLTAATKRGVLVWEQYINLLAHGQLRQAWNMLTPELRSGSTYASFEQVWVPREPYLKTYTIQEPKAENITATQFTLEFTYTAKPGTAPWYPYQRLWVDLKQIDGVWKIDTAATSPPNPPGTKR